MPEKANTHALCWLKTIRKGNALVIETTVAPKPKVTNMIGKAQQINVPVVVNSVKTVTLCSFIMMLFHPINVLIFSYYDK